MARASTGRVYQLEVEPPAQLDLTRTVQDRIRERIAAGNRVTRYAREWIIGRVEETGGVLAGRIGFQGSDATVEVWSDDERDFLPSAHPVGLTAPFALDLDALRLAVQPRGRDIRLNAVIGAFEALLSSDDGGRWHIRGLRTATTFEQWRASVARVTSVRITVRQPNPHYRDTPDLEALMEQARGEVVSLEMRNDDGDGIDLDSPFLTQTREHQAAGYGEGRYTGTREHNGQQVETSYSDRYGSEDENQELPVDPETGEVSADALRALAAADVSSNELDLEIDDNAELEDDSSLVDPSLNPDPGPEDPAGPATAEEDEDVQRELDADATPRRPSAPPRLTESEPLALESPDGQTESNGDPDDHS